MTTSEPIGDLHIDDFCKDTAKIFLMLYKRFPIQSTLYVEDISGPDAPDEFGLHSPRFEACFSTILWLKESDYIQFQSLVKQEAVENAVLSHRGFSLLSSIDQGSSLDIDSSGPPLKRRIDVVKQTLRESSSEDLKQLILRYMNDSRGLN